MGPSASGVKYFVQLYVGYADATEFAGRPAQRRHALQAATLVYA